MDIGNYLFGFNGRTNRAKWWLFLPIAIVYTLIVNYVILANMGLNLWVYLALQVPLWYMGTAVSIKRYHDRNQPAMFALIYPGIYIVTTIYMTYATWGVMAAASTITVNSTPEEIQAATNAAMQGITGGLGSMYWVLVCLQAVSAIFALVNLGILKGTTGDNQYGPDPLAGKA